MNPSVLVLLIFCLLLIVALIIIVLRLRKLGSQNQALQQEHGTLRQEHATLQQGHRALRERFTDVIDIEEEKGRITKALEARREQLSVAIGRLKAERGRAESAFETMRKNHRDEARTILEGIETLKKELDELSEQANLQEFGLYEPRYDFDTSERYKDRLEQNRRAQKDMIKKKIAAVCHTEWAVEGSKRKGQKMVNDHIKLVLRAFNGECDASIAKVKYNNVLVMEKRINKAWTALNKLSSSKNIEITTTYRDNKLSELYLAHEYQEKKYEEREEQRRIREEMREEERARREMEKAQKEAEKEEHRYQKSLEKARAEVEQATGAKQEKLQQQIEALKQRLEEAHANKERAISRAQMTRSGHVYIISNIGSFGEDIYKIGMTRRLDPMDRVKELGDASVPFRFDVHAIIYSDDAPALENKLHHLFNDRRVNRINNRKEFFQVTIDEIVDAVHANHGEIEITKLAEAEEYRKSLAALRAQDELAIDDTGQELIIPDAIRDLLSN